jgi:hypothetical protein
MAQNQVGQQGGQAADPGIKPPKKGEQFRCSKCGMAIQVTEGCSCGEDSHVHFHCCDREMQPV